MAGQSIFDVPSLPWMAWLDGTGSGMTLSGQGGLTGRTLRSVPNCSRRVRGASHDGIFGQPAHVLADGHIG